MSYRSEDDLEESASSGSHRADSSTSQAREIDSRGRLTQAEATVVWSESVERRRFLRTVYWTIGVAFPVGIALLAIDAIWRPRSPSSSVVPSTSWLFTAVAFVYIVYRPLRWRYRALRNLATSRAVVDRARRTLGEVEDSAIVDGELDVAGLWRASQERLNYYHDIALTQSQRSFISGQVAITVGFMVLAFAVSVAVINGTTAVALVAGGLGTVGAALAGYIGRTFFRAHDAATRQLGSYFSQPVEFSRYLAAERLASQLEHADRGGISSDHRRNCSPAVACRWG